MVGAKGLSTPSCVIYRKAKELMNPFLGKEYTTDLFIYFLQESKTSIRISSYWSRNRLRSTATLCTTPYVFIEVANTEIQVTSDTHKYSLQITGRFIGIIKKNFVLETQESINYFTIISVFSQSERTGFHQYKQIQIIDLKA